MLCLLSQGLKELSSPEAQCRVLRERLRAKGVKFKGGFPTQKEIAAQKAETEKLRDLEDIDSSAILQPGSKRGRASANASISKTAKKNDADLDGSSDDDSEASFDC